MGSTQSIRGLDPVSSPNLVPGVGMGGPIQPYREVQGQPGPDLAVWWKWACLSPNPGLWEDGGGMAWPQSSCAGEGDVAQPWSTFMGEGGMAQCHREKGHGLVPTWPCRGKKVRLRPDQATWGKETWHSFNLLCGALGIWQWGRDAVVTGTVHLPLNFLTCGYTCGLDAMAPQARFGPQARS